MSKAISKYLFCISICSSLAYSSIAVNVDSLLTKLNTLDSLENPREWVQLNGAIGKYYMEEDDYNKSTDHLRSALNVGRQNKFGDLLKEIELDFGHALYQQGNYDLSLTFLLPLIKNQLSKNDLERRGRALRVAGMSYVLLGEYAKAYDFQNEAVEIYKELKDSSSLAMVYQGLVNNFYYQEQNELAFQYANKLLEISLASNYRSGIARSYSVMCNLYVAENDYDKALEYNKLALEVALEDGDKESVAWAYFNMGGIYSGREEYTKAMSFYNKALQSTKETGDRPLQSYVYEEISTVMFKQNRLNDALTYLDSSFVIASEAKDLNYVMNLYKSYSNIHYEKGNYKLYKETIERSMALNDSLFSEELLNSMSSLEESFKIKEVERQNEIEILKKNKELERYRSYIALALASASAIILFLILFALYSRFKAQREKNELLMLKNREILRQNEILVSKNKDLEKFAFIIAHDLREPLRSISGFTTLLKRKIRKVADETTKEYMQFITNSTAQMGELLNDLLQYSKISVQDSDMQEVDANELVANVVADLELEFQNANVNFTKDELPVVLMNDELLYQVFANLIGNAIKFRRDEVVPTIHISSRKLEGNTEFSVEDNGIGIDKQYFEEIFVVFQRLHNREAYKGSGVGLSICKKVIEERGGKIWLTSTVGEGATFYFTIPDELPDTFKISELEEELEA